MSSSEKLSNNPIFVILAIVLGFFAGMFYQQRTEEHRLIMAEWKKITSINQLIDMKQQELIKTNRERYKERGQ